jgi:uncharacterized membrane protein
MSQMIGVWGQDAAAGLIWGLMSGKTGDAIKVFFLMCVIIAGIFGAATLAWTPLLIQTVPGAICFSSSACAIALLLLWISNSQAKKHLGTQGNF